MSQSRIILSYVSPPLTACLFVNPEGSYPKPSIAVSPGGVIPVGGNVTIRCRHQRLGMRILLYKAGDGNYLTYTDPAGSEAEFPITSARREHGGSYTCRYSNRTVRVAYSEPSDPVQIIVAGERPSPAPRLPAPHPRVALGGAVTIRCECRCAGARVLLSKAGDPDAWRLMDPTGNVAEFPIRNVNRGDAGNYSCQYSTKSDLSVWLEPSDPVELVVTGEGPGYTFPVPHPDGLSAGLGPDGTLRLARQKDGISPTRAAAGQNPRAGLGPTWDTGEVGEQKSLTHNWGVGNKASLVNKILRGWAVPLTTLWALKERDSLHRRGCHPPSPGPPGHLDSALWRRPEQSGRREGPRCHRYSPGCTPCDEVGHFLVFFLVFPMVCMQRGWDSVSLDVAGLTR
uniref:Ig-like domain-containing protein n=1 Tax=Chrysemys picta bellii TaxID=8478 RepID=A0A8C3HNF4_CHRPI